MTEDTTAAVNANLQELLKIGDRLELLHDLSKTLTKACLETIENGDRDWRAVVAKLSVKLGTELAIAEAQLVAVDACIRPSGDSK